MPEQVFKIAIGDRPFFFGRLREILGNRPEIRIVGDRFVFQSEVFFDPGSAELKESASPELELLVEVVLAILETSELPAVNLLFVVKQNLIKHITQLLSSSLSSEHIGIPDVRSAIWQ